MCIRDSLERIKILEAKEEAAARKREKQAAKEEKAGGKTQAGKQKQPEKKGRPAGKKGKQAGKREGQKLSAKEELAMLKEPVRGRDTGPFLFRGQEGKPIQTEAVNKQLRKLRLGFEPKDEDSSPASRLSSHAGKRSTVTTLRAHPQKISTRPPARPRNAGE